MTEDVLGILVAIIVPVSMFAMIFGIVYLYKRESLAMIERGMNPRANQKPLNASYMLRLGLMLIGAGIGLFLAYLLDRAVFISNNDNEAIYFALIAIFGGGGSLLSYFIEKKEADKRSEN